MDRELIGKRMFLINGEMFEVILYEDFLKDKSGE